MVKNFAITGVAGYVAPRHLKAIHDTGNRLVAATDPSDSVGILDRFSFDVRFFTEFERFDRHTERLRRQGESDRVHWVSICSPNYLHDAHMRFALRIGADAICEKPLVLSPWNCDALEELEGEYGRKIYSVLQLRHHPALIAIKQRLETEPASKKHEINLTYCTSRGLWYQTSWKGNVERSGGLATNIGIHFFDMLIWLFGRVEQSELHFSNSMNVSGVLELQRARVKWFLSTDRSCLPADVVAAGGTTYRSITIDGEEIEFTGGFTELHTRVYEEALAGRGFGLADTRPSIQLAYDIRHAVPTGVCAESHPFLRRQPFFPKLKAA